MTDIEALHAAKRAAVAARDESYKEVAIHRERMNEALKAHRAACRALEKARNRWLEAVDAKEPQS